MDVIVNDVIAMANDALENGDESIYIVLNTLAGCMLSNTVDLLATWLGPFLNIMITISEIQQED